MVGNWGILSVMTSKQKTVSMYCVTIMKNTGKNLKTVISVFLKNGWNRDVRGLCILAVWLANWLYLKKSNFCRFPRYIQYKRSREGRVSPGNFLIGHRNDVSRCIFICWHHVMMSANKIPHKIFLFADSYQCQKVDFYVNCGIYQN